MIRFALVLLLAAVLQAQDWMPTRIVAITDYALIARMARISGDVVIKCFLMKDGTVSKAEVVSGHSLLKEQARQNALLWKFQRAGATGDDTITLTYQYRLEGEGQNDRVTSFFVDLPTVVHIIAPPVYVQP